MRPYRITQIVFSFLVLCLIALNKLHGLSALWVVIPVVVYVSVLILSAIYIRWNFYIKSYHTGKDKQYITLTFDDGPATQTSHILDILKEEKVPAAFFVKGKNVVLFPELIKRAYDEGHIIGNHSYEHGFNFDWLGVNAMVNEIEETNNAVKNIIDKTPLFFRPPYGVTNPNLARAVKRVGMYSIGWSIRSFDTSAQDAQKVLHRVLGKLNGGDIILLHDTVALTGEILNEIIVQTRQKGFTFVSLNELLDINAYA